MKRLILCLLFCSTFGCSASNNEVDAGADDVGSNVDDTGSNVDDMSAVSDLGPTDTGTDVGTEDVATDDATPGDVGDDVAEDMTMAMSCATATPLTAVADSFEGDAAIDADGQRRFFTFTPQTAGGWIEISVAPTGPFEVVSVIYDAAGNQVAFGQPTATDRKHVFYRVPDTDPLCVEVAELGDFEGATPSSGTDHTFDVTVEPYLDSTYEEVEPNDGIGGSTPVAVSSGSRRNFTILADHLLATNDDWFSIDPGRTSPLMIHIEVPLQGPDGHGGTAPINGIGVVAETGARLGRVDDMSTRRLMVFEVPLNFAMNPADIFIHTSAPDNLGANPFYQLRGWFVDEDKERESIFDGNDFFDDAQQATPTVFTGGLSFAIAGNLSSENDTDHWSFYAAAGQQLELRCWSGRIGSAIEGMVVRLHGLSQGDVVRTETESESEDLFWGPGGTMPTLTIANTGFHTLALEPTSIDPNFASHYYMCEFDVTDP